MRENISLPKIGFFTRIKLEFLLAVILIILTAMPFNITTADSIEPWNLEIGSFLQYKYTHVEQVGSLDPNYYEFGYKIIKGDQIRFEFTDLNLTHATYKLVFLQANGSVYANRNDTVSGVIDTNGSNLWINNASIFTLAGSASHGLPFPCYPQSLDLIPALEAYSNPDQGCSKFLRIEEEGENVTFFAQGCAFKIEEVIFDTSRQLVCSMKRYLFFYLVEAELVESSLPTVPKNFPGFMVFSGVFSVTSILIYKRNKDRK